MTAISPPDWAALYKKHRDAMYRVAARTLRETGRTDDAEDVVMAAMESLMKSPPVGVVANWEAMMVKVTKCRALDLLKSAAIAHASSADLTDHDGASDDLLEDEVIEAVDRQRAAAVVWDKLAILNDRHRRVAWEYFGSQRSRDDIAAEMGVSPARISQMATAALKKLKEALETEGVAP